ncbi:hypothetical protein [Parasitella parasitica]|uniref:C2H2-type domain-containing protein n=1 Tax=Parasitella parasitica TaxID=35722 RepID=A0A0B7NWE8_9FUNG|nr:hypothetical protein [Parasitella parasitica]
MNTRFTFQELLTSPILHNSGTNEQERLNYYFNYQHWHTNIYTQCLPPSTPQPQPIQSVLSPTNALLPKQQPKQQQQEQQRQTMTRTRGRRVSNTPNHDIRTFTCKTDECGKVFKRSEHLKRHVRSIHTMEKRR